MKLEVKTNSGEVFFVEADPASTVIPGAPVDDEPHYRDGGLVPRGTRQGSGDVLDKTETMFSRAVDVIRSVSEDVTAGLMTTDKPPSEVELSLNLGFDAGGNVWIFKGGANANLKLVLKWRLPGGSHGSSSGPSGDSSR